MPKSKIGDIVRNADGTYTITYKIEFQLDKNDSTYPLNDFTFWDYLNYSDIFTDPKIRQYVIYNRDSVALYKKRMEHLLIQRLTGQILYKLVIRQEHLCIALDGYDFESGMF